MEKEGLTPTPATEQTFENANEVLENSINSLPESEPKVASETMEEVESIADKLIDKAKTVFETIKEETIKLADTIAEKTEEITDTVLKETEQLADTIAEKTEKLVDAVVNETKEVAGSVTKETEKIADTIAEKTEEITDTVIKETEQLADTIAEKTEEVIETVTEQIQPQVEPLKEPIEQTNDAVATENDDITDVTAQPSEPIVAKTETITGETMTQSEPEETISEKVQSEASPANEYAGKSKIELIELLALTIAERPIYQIRTIVDAIKITFYKILRAEIEAAKNSFVEAGNTADDFVAELDPIEARLKELIAQYRAKRDHYIANIETEKENNYKAKLAIIEEIKELTNSSETLHNTFNTFRELQNQWKEIGIVPQEKIKDLWDTYHHHVENFYNYVKINKELRDIDLKRNYEAKMLLCEEAEALTLDTSATSAFHKLQKLHDQWRETGPVALEYKDQIWERFKEASTRVNKRHQEYYDGIKDEQERNLRLKEELCIKVEEFAVQTITTRKEWGDASDQIAEIQKIWKTIGFAPKKENTAIYERFRAACDKFFESKRQFFGEMKNEMEDNLQVKIDLCIQAEALVESEDWKAATEALIELQKKWKQSGAVARKHADEVWKRFRGACDKFFERKSEHFNNIDSKFAENLEAKKLLLQELTESVSDQASLTFDKLKEYQRRWSEIGFVPIKQKEAISKQYKEIVDKMFTILRGGEGERRMERFKEKVSNFKDGGRIGTERDKLYNKVRQIEADIQVWENNIGFFAKSKNADVLVKEVENKIEKAKAEIAEIVEKIKMIDNS